MSVQDAKDEPVCRCAEDGGEEDQGCGGGKAEVGFKRGWNARAHVLIRLLLEIIEA